MQNTSASDGYCVVEGIPTAQYGKLNEDRGAIDVQLRHGIQLSVQLESAADEHYLCNNVDPLDATCSTDPSGGQTYVGTTGECTS